MKLCAHLLRRGKKQHALPYCGAQHRNMAGHVIATSAAASSRGACWQTEQTNDATLPPSVPDGCNAGRLPPSNRLPGLVRMEAMPTSELLTQIGAPKLVLHSHPPWPAARTCMSMPPPKAKGLGPLMAKARDVLRNISGPQTNCPLLGLLSYPTSCQDRQPQPTVTTAPH